MCIRIQLLTRVMLPSGAVYLNLHQFQENRMEPKLFGLFSEQRRLHFQRLIFRGFVGFSSQMNGARFRQSNILL